MYALSRPVSLILSFWFAAFVSPVSLAQNKSACEFLTKADVESVLGMTLEPAHPYAPFRSLLDKDFSTGTIDQGCSFTNVAQGKPRPQKPLSVNIEVRYSQTPVSTAVQQLRAEIKNRTFQDPVEVAGLGDTALWIGPDNDGTLFVFSGGKMTFMIGPSMINMEQEKALALKALGSASKTGFIYGPARTPLSKPSLATADQKPGQLYQLKRELTTKAEAGSVPAQMALGNLYQYGDKGTDGIPKPDYAGAAYWYRQASDHGDPLASFQLAILSRRGLGVPEDPHSALELFEKAALAGYVPAMAPAANLYMDQDTPTSMHRAIEWASESAKRGDPEGLLIRGYLYNKGALGGDPPFWYAMAMPDYQKSAEKGNCVAMMNIGGLYFNGNGVPQDKVQAANWFAKAEACSGPGLEWVKEKAAKFREKASTGHLPQVTPEIKALTDRQKLAAGLLSMLAIAIAAEIANPSPRSGDASNGSRGGPDYDAIDQNNRQMEMNRRNACIISGGKPALGCY